MPDKEILKNRVGAAEALPVQIELQAEAFLEPLDKSSILDDVPYLSVDVLFPNHTQQELVTMPPPSRLNLVQPSGQVTEENIERVKSILIFIHNNPDKSIPWEKILVNWNDVNLFSAIHIEWRSMSYHQMLSRDDLRIPYCAAFYDSFMHRIYRSIDDKETRYKLRARILQKDTPFSSEENIKNSSDDIPLLSTDVLFPNHTPEELAAMSPLSRLALVESDGHVTQENIERVKNILTFIHNNPNKIIPWEKVLTTWNDVNLFSAIHIEWRFLSNKQMMSPDHPPFPYTNAFFVLVKDRTRRTIDDLILRKKVRDRILQKDQRLRKKHTTNENGISPKLSIEQAQEKVHQMQIEYPGMLSEHDVEIINQFNQRYSTFPENGYPWKLLTNYIQLAVIGKLYDLFSDENSMQYLLYAMNYHHDEWSKNSNGNIAWALIDEITSGQNTSRTIHHSIFRETLPAVLEDLRHTGNPHAENLALLYESFPIDIDQETVARVLAVIYHHARNPEDSFRFHRLEDFADLLVYFYSYPKRDSFISREGNESEISKFIEFTYRLIGKIAANRAEDQIMRGILFDRKIAQAGRHMLPSRRTQSPMPYDIDPTIPKLIERQRDQPERREKPKGTKEIRKENILVLSTAFAEGNAYEKLVGTALRFIYEEPVYDQVPLTIYGVNPDGTIACKNILDNFIPRENVALTIEIKKGHEELGIGLDYVTNTVTSQLAAIRAIQQRPLDYLPNLDSYEYILIVKNKKEKDELLINAGQGVTILTFQNLLAEIHDSEIRRAFSLMDAQLNIHPSRKYHRNEHEFLGYCIDFLSNISINADSQKPVERRASIAMALKGIIPYAQKEDRAKLTEYMRSYIHVRTSQFDITTVSRNMIPRLGRKGVNPTQVQSEQVSEEFRRTQISRNRQRQRGEDTEHSLKISRMSERQLLSNLNYSIELASGRFQRFQKNVHHFIHMDKQNQRGWYWKSLGIDPESWILCSLAYDCFGMSRFQMAESKRAPRSFPLAFYSAVKRTAARIAEQRGKQYGDYFFNLVIPPRSPNYNHSHHEVPTLAKMDTAFSYSEPMTTDVVENAWAGVLLEYAEPDKQYVDNIPITIIGKAAKRVSDVIVYDDVAEYGVIDQSGNITLIQLGIGESDLKSVLSRYEKNQVVLNASRESFQVKPENHLIVVRNKVKNRNKPDSVSVNSIQKLLNVAVLSDTTRLAFQILGEQIRFQENNPLFLEISYQFLKNIFVQAGLHKGALRQQYIDKVLGGLLHGVNIFNISSINLSHWIEYMKLYALEKLHPYDVHTIDSKGVIRRQRGIEVGNVELKEDGVIFFINN